MAQDTDATVAAMEWVGKTHPGLDPICGDNGYPTEIELTRIRSWGQGERLTRDLLIEQIAYVRQRWKYADMGYWQAETDKDGGVFYSISTGGWSGNEDLMGALHESYYWMLCFESHFRGGHYTFKLPVWKESEVRRELREAAEREDVHA